MECALYQLHEYLVSKDQAKSAMFLPTLVEATHQYPDLDLSDSCPAIIPGPGKDFKLDEIYRGSLIHRVMRHYPLDTPDLGKWIMKIIIRYERRHMALRPTASGLERELGREWVEAHPDQYAAFSAAKGQGRYHFSAALSQHDSDGLSPLDRMILSTKSGNIFGNIRLLVHLGAPINLMTPLMPKESTTPVAWVTPLWRVQRQRQIWSSGSSGSSGSSKEQLWSKLADLLISLGGKVVLQKEGRLYEGDLA
jgi:hypothetical protein